MTLTILKVTPEMRKYIDPTTQGRQFVSGFVSTVGTPVPPEYAHFSREEWLQRWLDSPASKLSSRHIYYARYRDEMIQKYGTQGIGISKADLQAIAKEYYSLATDATVASEAFYVGLQYLLQRILLRKEEFADSQSMLRRVSTLSGLTSMAHKGSFLAETAGMKPGWRHMNACLPGQRYMRNSPRTIFIDDVTNVRYIEESMARVRNWLKTTFPEYFSGWLRPDKATGPMFYAALSEHAVSIEADYDKCDQHVHRGIALALLPIYELLLPEEEFWHLSQAFYELFEIPLYWGDELWTGLHNLFSGQVITNDIETLYDICMMIGVCIIKGIDPERVRFAANGDDLTILIPAKLRKNAEGILSLYADQAALDGHVISQSKSRISDSDVRFCRRVYYPGLRVEYNEDGVPYYRGAYPSVLALNSIVNPERFESDPTVRFVADISRADVVCGSPDYAPFVQYVFSNRKTIIDTSETNLSKVSLPFDWWERVYGDSFSIGTSVTYRFLKAQRLVKSYAV